MAFGLKGFAQGLHGDPAVRAALRMEWSNGQVENQINRLKLIKRQMYGQTGSDLLHQRILYRERWGVTPYRRGDGLQFTG